MDKNGGWWDAAHKINSWLTGTLLVVGFLSGIGAFLGGMKYFRQEMVTAETYVLKSSKDYISSDAYARIVRERDAAIQQRDEAARHGDELADYVKQRDAIIANLSDRKQAIVDLENMRVEAGKQLERARIKLAMASPIMAFSNEGSDKNSSENNETYQEYKREINSIEQNIHDIDQKILELRSLIHKVSPP